ncbi:hypothetical protein EC991_004586 [Linnemannia zychae]|nr:hypothetical protein EC991_004586 [Linnemannia zychae]
MSKRATENQLTKDNYDQEDQDSGPQMGAFKMATSDELARRPMKALRRLGSRTLSNLSDDGKRSSPTSSQSSTPNIPSSSSPGLLPATSPANPFANVTFGTTPAKTARLSKDEASFPGPQSRSDSTGKPATRQMGRLARSITAPTTTTSATTNSNTAPAVSLPSSILAKSAFTFNIGSNANTLAITTPVSTPVEPVTIDREGYERSLRGVNQGFLKRIQRSLEHNATANLAGTFEAYIEHRKKVKKQYPGIEEPQTIVLSSSNVTDGSDVIPPKKSFSGFGVNATSDTTATSVPAPPASSPFVNLAGSGLLGAQQGDRSDRVADDTKSELVDSRKGEEDERTVYEVRAKLFGTENNEFQDLGVGQFRVNEHNVTMKRRMIMRTSGTGLITLNSWIIPRMAPQRNKTTLTIFAVENGKPKKFVLRVKEESLAQELLNILEASQSTSSS